MAPHALYTLEPDTLKAARALADEHGVPLLIHLAETRAEVDAALTLGQATPVGYLESLGMWGPRTLAAHGVWVSADDIEAAGAARRRGLAQPREQHEARERHRAGRRLPAGAASRSDWAPTAPPATTTSTCSRPCGSTALLHKLQRNDPRVLPAGEVLAMATIGGARALGLGDRIGSLEVGKRADLIVVAADGARQTPMYDPISHLVYVAHGDDVTDHHRRRAGADARSARC